MSRPYEQRGRAFSSYRSRLPPRNRHRPDKDGGCSVCQHKTAPILVTTAGTITSASGTTALDLHQFCSTACAASAGFPWAGR